MVTLVQYAKANPLHNDHLEWAQCSCGALHTVGDGATDFRCAICAGADPAIDAKARRARINVAAAEFDFSYKPESRD
ncbi:hypothetical protein A2801_03135 [Candidatus Woesebacteria bacterium RIFCSPHIGHO2_01_FULL_41_10]|uniref:Uncharacterized protein n=1 Tax=Candidatus Woesebacteria bacterium RIFCSPHIGHO2_01_FULL_41_10 TaxID=1802500 RepID=A0A1F7YT37_9BACT|nr:MAG: hypothetical protein A2801_03135 [Candidatus Woesebacteria bacterium RIFCSPHIGHO2_01_FULL_41_10]